MAAHLTHEEILALPLSAQAVAYEEYRHRACLADLKRAAPALKLLEAEHTAIKAAGYTIHPEAISLIYREKLTLGIMGSMFDGEVRLCKALLEVGFVIVERGQGSTATVYPKKGRLRIRLFMSAKDLARVDGLASESAEAA